MAFNLQMFAAGVAENITETLQQDRERAQKLIDDSLKTWTELGVENVKKRRSKRQDLRKVADSLKGYGLNTDQIDVIIRQGRSEDVINSLATMTQRGIEVKPAEVVSFMPSYKETGRTIDQMLDDYMGKVSRGMDSSDALIDATGGKVKGTFGQDLGKIMTKRVDAFSNAFGLSAPEMRAYAMEDYEYGAGVEGRISLVDPVAKAQAEQAMRGTTTGQFTSQGAQQNVINALYRRAGGKINPQTGGPQYDPDLQKLQADITDETNKILNEIQERENISTFKLRHIIEASDRVGEKLGIKPVQPPPPPPLGATGTGATSSTGFAPQMAFQGMTTSSIKRQALNRAKTAKPGDVQRILNAARAAIIADLTKTMGPQRADMEANQIIQDIQSQI